MTRSAIGDPAGLTPRLTAAEGLRLFLRHLPGLGPRPAVIVALALASSVAAGAGAGWSSSGSARAPTADGRHQPASTQATVSVAHPSRITRPVTPARLTVASVRPGLADWNSPLRLRVSNGSLRSMHVVGDIGVLPGTVSATGTTWVSSTTLVPSTTYTVIAVLRQSDGSLITRHAQLRSTPAAHTVTVGIFPSNGSPVGVGQPVVAYFSGPVTDRAAAQQALAVRSVPTVAGAWRWFSATEVHYRPARYWPAGATVTITPALRRVQLAPGVWGVDQPPVTVHIGAAHVSVVDVTAHTMTVYSGGQVVRVFKVSTGRAKYPTRAGIHVVLSKQPDMLMDSATVGIPRNSPDGYYEHVAWDVRISDGGAFVHSAPWSVKDQGVRNVSHGCVNLSPTDGQWFYNFSQPGDVVNILHSTAPPLLTDPGTEDWNYPWAQWLQGNTAGA